MYTVNPEEVMRQWLQLYRYYIIVLKIILILSSFDAKNENPPPKRVFPPEDFICKFRALIITRLLERLSSVCVPRNDLLINLNHNFCEPLYN